MKTDRYFDALYERTHSEQDLTTAGWLEKPTQVNQQLRYYTTPVDAIRDAGKEEVSVLFYPGCFAPVHEGHITAMRLAKEAVEATGETVVAGFFTPDHDDYIMRKTHDERFTAANRVELLHAVTKTETWMQVDPWAAQYAPTDLNFTTLYDRLNQYLKRWVPNVKVKLYMVFGGDNYMFANAFTEYGYGVCVPREGVSIDWTTVHPDAQKRVVLSTKSSTNHSSTAARAMYSNPAEKGGRSTMGKRYVLRNDLDAAFENTTEYPNYLIAQTLQILFHSHLPEDISVQTVDIHDQFQHHQEKAGIISMDSFWKAEYNLDITRLFNAAGGQNHPLRYINRPGSDDLQTQIKRIPEGEYVLADDDIATGETMKFVSNVLGTHGIRIVDTLSLIDELNTDLYDLADMRDYVLGAKNGGLTVVAPNGQVTRMPYFASYVNVSARTRIQPNKARSFSIEIWKLNRSLYKNSSLTVGDIKEHQDFTLFGFSEQMRLVELCEKHLELLGVQS